MRAFLPHSSPEGLDQGEKNGIFAEKKEKTKAEQGCAECFSCCLQEISIPVWKGQLWKPGQVSKEWDSFRSRADSKTVTNFSQEGQGGHSTATEAFGTSVRDTSVPLCKLSTSSKEAAEVSLEIQGWDKLDPAPCQVGQNCSQSLKVNRALTSHLICASHDTFETQFPHQNQLGFKLSQPGVRRVPTMIFPALISSQRCSHLEPSSSPAPKYEGIWEKRAACGPSLGLVLGLCHQGEVPHSVGCIHSAFSLE